MWEAPVSSHWGVAVRRVLVVGTALAMVGLVPATSHAATPQCFGQAATIVGTPGDDRLVGTGEDDVIVGLGGNDVILARGGWDWVCAGDGDDLVVGGWGADNVRGLDGNDTIYGEYRQTSRNRAIASCYEGFAAATSVAACYDNLEGGRGDDVIAAGPDYDQLRGGPGTDILRGQGSFDGLNGGAGNDIIRGGASSSDTVTYRNSPAAIHADLAADMATGHGDDILLAVEEIVGSHYDDVLYGDDGKNWLAGGDDRGSRVGDDILVGRGGPDRMSGAAGDDRMWGGPGRDSLFGDGGIDRLDGGLERDLCIGETTRHCERTAW